jgi:hypothetical protein
MYLFPFIYPKNPCSPQHRQAKRHPKTVPNNVQLAPLDLLPANRNFGHGDVGALSQHQHLNVEDPAFRVHVGNDIGQRGSGEQLEAALGVLDRRRFGRGEKAEQQVEGVHEGVAEEGALVCDVSGRSTKDYQCCANLPLRLLPCRPCALCFQRPQHGLESPWLSRKHAQGHPDH